MTKMPLLDLPTHVVRLCDCLPNYHQSHKARAMNLIPKDSCVKIINTSEVPKNQFFLKKWVVDQFLFIL